MHMSSESRPSVSVSPAVPAVTVDQVPKAACSVSTRSRWMRAPKCARRLTRLSSMTCAERVDRRQRRAHAPQSRRFGVSTSSRDVDRERAHLACPDPRAYRPPGRRTRQYAGKVRAQSATVAPCGYVWSAKAAVVSQMSPHIGAAGFSVRSGRVSAPSRLHSLTWMDPVSDLPSVLLPFPRLWGLRPAVVRFSARRRPSPTRSSRPSGSQSSQRARDRSIRIVSGVWFDAWNLLVQEGLTAFGRSMLSGWIADLERTRCDLGRLIRRLRESGGQWRSRRCAASDERSSPNAAGSFPKASGTT